MAGIELWVIAHQGSTLVIMGLLSILIGFAGVWLMTRIQNG